MKYELNIYELGQLLTKVTEEYKVELLSKLKLSGGWMTMTGKVDVVSVPENKVVLKGNNIITLNVSDVNCKGSLLKITGAKEGIFHIDISPTKYKEFGATGLNLNKTKINNNETKIRIDEDMIFTIREASVDSIEKIIKSI
ncbi:UDP-N-acetylglucosamine pyrophosphorylase [Clostridium sp. Sa3CUN1]|uniref:UDP-N-acetylglucosamine pyrophosphorylase n=1 Tax=Clostridium gallinarum TaxID=2762246 RepID=A0ABR8Q7A5_9CLOT|nr:UDP-N-acetylglucosamine pyrophosphorylase [Clostridium gallinarum]MBD7916308.1 UDP-N-acetylglucosamine pyrophosphorylase [Clostridium gallinarum]